MGYRDDLVKEIEKRKKNFEQMKEAVVLDIQNLKPHEAVDYGASATSRIEMLTVIAAEWKVLAEQLRMYDFTSGQSEDVDYDWG